MGISTRVFSLSLSSSSPSIFSLDHSSQTLSVSTIFGKLKKRLKTMICKGLETGTLLDEIRSMDKAFFFDLGHPLLNRMADCFIKASGIGAIQALSREAYFATIDGLGYDSNGAGGMPSDITRKKRHRFPRLEGETNKKSLEAMVRSTGKESIQWGVAAGMYSGLTYGLKEARGSHDWKNSAVAGAITGVAMAITSDFSSREQIVQCAITGAAISTAANLLTGIF